jgi:hypothetical protein
MATSFMKPSQVYPSSPPADFVKDYAFVFCAIMPQPARSVANMGVFAAAAAGANMLRNKCARGAGDTNANHSGNLHFGFIFFYRLQDVCTVGKGSIVTLALPVCELIPYSIFGWDSLFVEL